MSADDIYLVWKGGTRRYNQKIKPFVSEGKSRGFWVEKVYPEQFEKDVLALPTGFTKEFDVQYEYLRNFFHRKHEEDANRNDKGLESKPYLFIAIGVSNEVAEWVIEDYGGFSFDELENVKASDFFDIFLQE